MVTIIKDFEKAQKSILDNFPYGIIFVNKNKKILYANSVFEILTNNSKKNIINKEIGDDFLRCYDERGTLLCFNCPIIEAIQERKVKKIECFIDNKLGYKLPVIEKIIPVYDGDEYLGSTVIFEDNISKYLDLKKIKKYEQLAMLDSLTGLPNRRLFENMFDRLLYKVRRFKEYSFGLIFIDIDDFKKINDTFGHDIGDDILKKLANILEKSLRQYDIASRYGGEEFILLLQYIDNLDRLFFIGDRLRESISKKLLLPNGNSVTVSMGGTIAKKDDTKESLIKRADSLMYESKKSGKNKITVG